MTVAARSRSSATFRAPSSQQITAPVHEFRCTFTHDIKRKNAKRWKDGFLKFHTFNNRLLVYDEARNFVQSGYHAGPAATIGDGAAFSLDIILVEVGAPMGVSQTDLSEIVKKRSPKRPWDSARPSIDRQGQQQPRSLDATRNLKSLVTANALAPLQVSSAQKQAEPETLPLPPSKRPRTDDNHKSILDILKTKPVPPSQGCSGNYSQTPRVNTMYCSTASPRRRRTSTNKEPVELTAVASLAGCHQTTRKFNSQDRDGNDCVFVEVAVAIRPERKQHLMRSMSNGGKKVTSKRPRDGPEIGNPGLNIVHRLELPDTQIAKATVHDRDQDLSANAIQERPISPVNINVGFQVSGTQQAPPILLQHASHRPEQHPESAAVTQRMADLPPKGQELHISRGHTTRLARKRQDLSPRQATHDIESLMGTTEEPESITRSKKIQSIRIRARAPRRMLCQALEDGAAQSLVPDAQDETPLKATDFSAMPLPDVTHRISAVRRDYSHLDAQLPAKSLVSHKFNDLPKDLTTNPQVKSPLNNQIDSGICHQSLEWDATIESALIKSPLSTLNQRRGRARVFVTAVPPPSSPARRFPRRHSSGVPSMRPMASVPAGDIVTSVPSFNMSGTQVQRGDGKRSPLRRHETIGHAPRPRSCIPAPTPHLTLTLHGAASRPKTLDDKGPWTSEAWDLFGCCPEEMNDDLGWAYDSQAIPGLLQ